jgi:hypothetical protein
MTLKRQNKTFPFQDYNSEKFRSGINKSRYLFRSITDDTDEVVFIDSENSSGTSLKKSD